jgi:hypothetical protein
MAKDKSLMVGITKVEVNKIVDFNFFTLKRYWRYPRYVETKKRGSLSASSS